MGMPTPLWVVWLAINAAVFLWACNSAFHIRMHAINEYGKIIHEFDPWFNYRATKYLADNGWTEFFHWYDYKSWYPIGRPVGTTIYPGMQITSVVIWNVLKQFGSTYTLMDVCCLVPPWFGVVATTFVTLLTAECAKSMGAGVAAGAVMSIIPAHIMRSVGGGYDNESIAVSAMCCTFYFWVRSVRNEKSWWIGAIAGLAYVYMVAVWGGYVFVINMIGVHAGALAVLGFHSTGLHRAYTLFFVIGTYGATCVPVVGLTPIKSLEQMGPMLVFWLIQGLELCDVIKRRRNLGWLDVQKLRVFVFAAATLVFIAFVVVLLPTGFFSPLSARIRGLFVKHTRTGNPLVDSVAEHQPASAQAYWQYLHYMCYVAPVGLVMAMIKLTPGSFFLILYAGVGYTFSLKMVRLVLLMGPITSALSGYALGLTAEWAFCQILALVPQSNRKIPSPEDEEDEDADAVQKTEKEDKGKKGKKKKKDLYSVAMQAKENIDGLYKVAEGHFLTVYNLLPVRMTRVAIAIGLVIAVRPYFREFEEYCNHLAVGMSNPSIVFKAQLSNGQVIMVTDYLDAYYWLRDNTPKEARVMAWWDYGYQITGIGERTSIADGNTWNHEHIATLGKCLASEENLAHSWVRHLADYVLVWTGGGGDDLAKSPHMARIGNSVFHDICPGDPTCRQFGFINNMRTPTPMMAQSLLYKLVSHNQAAGVSVNASLFREVYTSKYNKVRIYKVLKVSKKSRSWINDPANRKCDAPGSWYCVGEYPPALQPLVAKRSNFKQLEDFNKAGTERDKQYYEEYMKRMNGEATDEEWPVKYFAAHAPPNKEEAQWEDTALTTEFWNLINKNQLNLIKKLIQENPNVVHVRSSDGRGPLWWAYEYKRDKIAQFLIKNGCDPNAKDSRGQKADPNAKPSGEPKKKKSGKKKKKSKKDEM